MSRVINVTTITRAVDPNWECSREGDCCTKPPHVYMTIEEARVLSVAASVHKPAARLTFNTVPGSEFVALVAAPCPLLDYSLDGRASCSVYSSRPYNCRRFACLRPDPKSEPWEEEADTGGCVNMLERVRQSRVARRVMELLQRKSQKWARRNGWK